MGIIEIPIVITCGFVCLRQGYRPAYYYLIAWFIWLTGLFIFMLKQIGLLPNIFLIIWMWRIGSVMEVVLFSLGLADRFNTLKKEKYQAQQLALKQQQQLTAAYQRFVPPELLNLLDKKSILDIALGDQIQREMSILFSDIRSFTTLSEQMTPEDNFRFINSYLSKMGPLVHYHQGFIDKYMGDAIMALFDKEADHSVQAAIAMLQLLEKYNEERKQRGWIPIQIGIGINTGMMMLGTVGEQNN